MKLIIGLGNPGKQYLFTRHNLGFIALEELARMNGIKLKLNKRFRAISGEGTIKGESCYLGMPQTFMNLSGHSIRSIVNWLKINLADILLIVDDIMLPFGDMRVRPKGSDGGHNGLKSAIASLGTDDFSRMRIGIAGRKIINDTSRYVLEPFTKKEQKKLPVIMRNCAAACECWIEKGVGETMNRFNSRNKAQNQNLI